MKFDIKTIIIGLLILVTLYLFMCRGNKTVIEKKPETKPDTETKKEVAKAETNSNKKEDSLKSVISILNSSLYKSENSLQDEKLKATDLQHENGRLLSQLKASELTEQIISQADKIQESQRIKDSLCDAIATDLKTELSIKDQSIRNKDALYSSIKKQLDTCLKDKNSLDNYGDKVKPHNKLSLGIVANVYPNAGIGIGSDFITKKGVVYSGQCLYMLKDWYIVIGLKKIISFR